MLNIDIEKKLNNLKEGTYYKTLNGKTYEIHVKNIEDNNKILNVYYNKNLIFESNYYKDGKMMERGKEMREDYNNHTLNDIIEKMLNLSEGYAKYDNKSICVKESKKIDDNSSTSFKVEIEDDEFLYDFRIPFTNEYYINIKSKNMDFNIFTKKDKMSIEKDNRSLTFMSKDKKYALTNQSLTNLYDEKNYFVLNNNLLHKVDEKHYIGYNFDNNKVYVYFKKNNAVSNDIENDYNKVMYLKNLGKAGEICTGILDTLMKKAKETIKDQEFTDMIDNIKIPKLDVNFDAYYDEINELAVLYKTYSSYLNLLDDDKVLNSIHNLVVNANITLIDKKINDFKDHINNNSLKDLDNLYELRKQLREIIKLKKKQNRTKKKILKNTDIEN